MVRFCQPLNRMPTPARVVLALGVALLMLALVNARLADIVTPELQRAEVLSGMAAVGLMLVAVLWTRADPSQAPRRDLKGEQGLVLVLTSMRQYAMNWAGEVTCFSPQRRQRQSWCTGTRKCFSGEGWSGMRFSAPVPSVNGPWNAKPPSAS